jgi:MoaA/NifB/PqqE/SkfB family radical SAM enzyme
MAPRTRFSLGRRGDGEAACDGAAGVCVHGVDEVDEVLPKTFFLQVTGECLLRCRVCDIWRDKDPEGGLDVAEKRRVLEDIHAWVGESFVTFYGGEPYLRRDEMAALCGCCRDLRHYATTNTNGVLIDEPLAKEIAGGGLDNMGLSVDSFRPEVHDRIRGVDGTFDKAMAALGHLNRHRRGMALRLNAIILDANAAELPGMVDEAVGRGADGMTFQAYYPQGFKHGVADFRADEFWPKDMVALERSMKELIDAKRRGAAIGNTGDMLEAMRLYFRGVDPSKLGECVAGSSNFIVDVAGDVRLCFCKAPIGNVRKKGLREIWRSDEAARMRDEIARCRASCRILNCVMYEDMPRPTALGKAYDRLFGGIWPRRAGRLKFRKP